MKTFFLSFLIIFCLHTLNAQSYKTTFSSNEVTNKMVIQIEGGQIDISGHSSNEVVVEAKGYEPPPKKAEGLKPLYASGQDNSGIGLSVQQEGNTLQLVGIRSYDDTDYIIKIPNKTSVAVRMGPRNDNLRISNLKGEIELQAHSDDVLLHNVSGPIVANAISSNMEVKMDQVNSQKPTAISLVSGDLDISLPASLAADLKVTSVSGEVYTDFDIDVESSDEMQRRRKPIVGTINGGGAEIELRTVSGNIYLRKN